MARCGVVWHHTARNKWDGTHWKHEIHCFDCVECIDWVESESSNGVMAAKRVVVAVHVVKAKCSPVHSSDIHSVTAVAERKLG